MQPAREELQVEFGGDADSAVDGVRHRRDQRGCFAGPGLGRGGAQGLGERTLRIEADLRGKPGYEPLLSLGLKASTRDTAGKKLLLMLRDDFLQRPPMD